MKKLIISILTIFFITIASSQTIVGIGNGEYVIGYRMSDGTAKIFSQNTITPVLQSYTGLDSIVDMQGAQYSNVLLDQRGKAYTVGTNHTVVTTVGNDQFGSEFKDNWFARGFWQNYITIRDVDSSLWYWGIGDFMNYAAGATITAPIKITSPGSRKAKKVETASTNSPGSLTKFYVLYSDSTVWQFDRGAGMTSVNITPSGEKVVDFGIASFYGIAMVTASNKIYAKGLFDGRYVGMTSHSTTTTDVTSRWTGAGLTFPVKEIASGFEVIHMIDNANNMYGSGSTQMGNVGIGDERPNLKTASGSHGIWGVDFSVNGYMLVMPPVLVARGVKNMQGGTTLALQRWVQDLNNNWYSWGRNKAFSLGNGISLGPYVGWGGTGSYDIYPNAKDVTMPKKVTPLTSPYTLINFNAEDDPAPSVGAGINQYITTPTTTMLGRVHQQEFTITSTTWSKLSGPTGGTITTPSSLTTGITDLQDGTYVYQLSSTNSNGQTSTDNVDIVVSGVPAWVTKDTTFSGKMARVTYVDGYTDSTRLFIFVHGLGEVGTTTNKSQLYGFHYWINNGKVPSDFVNIGDGVTVKYPVFVTLQLATGFPNPSTMIDEIDAVFSRFKVKRRNAAAFGLSRGAGFWNDFIAYKTTVGGYSYAQNYFSSIVNLAGMKPDDTYGSAVNTYPAKFGQSFLNSNVSYLGIEQVLDGREVNVIVDNIQDSIGTGSPRIAFFWTNFGASGHANFNDMYDPSQNNWTLSNPDVQSTNGGSLPTTIPIATGLNLYQWADSRMETGSPSGSFIVDAGEDAEVYLPTTSATLSGFASGGTTPYTYLWTRVSGPNTPTIVSSTSASTSVTGLVVGTYVFRLQVTDNASTVSTDEVVITVKYSPSELSISSNSTSGTASTASLTSTLSPAHNIVSTQWTKLSGPSQPQRKIVFIGSSTTAGFNSTGYSSGVTTDSSYVGRVLKHYNDLGMLTTTTGVNLGTSSTDVYNGQPSWYVPPGGRNTPLVGKNITAALALNPDVIVVNYPSNSYDFLTITEIMAGFRRIKATADSAGKVTFITTTQPRPGFAPSEELFLIQIADSIRAQFPNNYIEFYDVLADENNPQAFTPAYDGGDNVHTNDAGYRQLARRLIATNVFKSFVTTGSNISTPTTPNTNITGLSIGTHKFQVSIVDARGLAASSISTSEMTEPPVELTVSAGADITVNRKVGFVVLKGVVNQPTATRVWTRLTTGAEEIGHILASTKDTTGVTILPYKNGAYQYELAATYLGTTIRDTVNVNVTYGTTPPQTGNPAIRMVTSGDVTMLQGLGYTSAAIGDAIVLGANETVTPNPGFNIDVYINNPAGISVGPGKHIWVPSGQYSVITMNFDSGQVVGTPANPVILTNYGGQVEAITLALKNLTHTTVTGKYVAGISGHSNYKGHDSAYAFSQGKYGIYLNSSWQSISKSSLVLSGKWNSNITFDHIEAGNGNFAGTFFKDDDNAANDYDSITVKDSYFHDLHGEGHYIGTTGSGLKQMFNALNFTNNRTLRSGNEGFQFGKQNENNVVSRNVFMNNAMNWRSTFERFNQAKGIQQGIQNGKNSFKNNIVRGSGDESIIAFSQSLDARYASNNDTFHITNNLFDYSKSFIGAYIAGTAPVSNMKINMSNNLFARAIFKGDSAYTGSYATNTQHMVRTANGSYTFLFKNNIRDNSKNTYNFGHTGTLDSSGNTVNASVPQPEFVNSGWNDSFDHTTFDMWTDSLFATWGNEYGADGGTRHPYRVIYKLNDYVTFLSKIYRSKVNNNQGNMPTGVTDAFWELQTWTDGTNVYTYPPDDYRLKAGTYYQQRNMGLLDNLTPVVIPDNPSQILRVLIRFNTVL